MNYNIQFIVDTLQSIALIGIILMILVHHFGAHR